jgi:hypothetical protein
MRNAPGQSSAVRRHLRLGAALSFLLFLIASAPHRVHHFFEQFPSSAESASTRTHEHADGTDHSHENHENRPGRQSQQNDCVVLSVAQHAHASLVQIFSFTVTERIIARDREQSVLAIAAFNSAPCSQRAPPTPV